jgi:hypothetical protein
MDTQRMKSQSKWGGGLATLVIGLLLFSLTGCINSEVTASIDTLIEDPEHRTEPLDGQGDDDPLDLTPLDGMPAEYHRAVTDYVQIVLDEIKAQPLSRTRYYHRDRSNDPGRQNNDRFPDDVIFVVDREVSLSITLFPRPEVVNRWTMSQDGQSIGGRSADVALQEPGQIYGRTLIFEPGPRSSEPHSLPAAPLGASIPSWNQYVPDLDYNVPFFCPLQKVVTSPFLLPLQQNLWVTTLTFQNMLQMSQVLGVPAEQSNAGWTFMSVASP